MPAETTARHVLLEWPRAGKREEILTGCRRTKVGAPSSDPFRRSGRRAGETQPDLEFPALAAWRLPNEGR